MLAADVEAIRRSKGRVLPFVFPHLTCVALFRLAAHLRSGGRVYPARIVCVVNQLLTGAEIDPAAKIGAGLHVVHTNGVIVGPGVEAGRNLTLWGQTTLGALAAASNVAGVAGFPRLGDNVTLFAKASVLGPVSVGNGATVGAHGLVLDDIPDGAVAVGVPARVRQPHNEPPPVRN